MTAAALIAVDDRDAHDDVLRSDEMRRPLEHAPAAERSFRDFRDPVVVQLEPYPDAEHGQQEGVLTPVRARRRVAVGRSGRIRCARAQFDSGRSEFPMSAAIFHWPSIFVHTVTYLPVSVTLPSGPSTENVYAPTS